MHNVYTIKESMTIVMEFNVLAIKNGREMIKNSITNGLGGKRSPSFGGHEVLFFS
jgi:hypothetical protein